MLMIGKTHVCRVETAKRILVLGGAGSLPHPAVQHLPHLTISRVGEISVFPAQGASIRIYNLRELRSGRIRKRVRLRRHKVRRTREEMYIAGALTPRGGQ